MPAEKKDITPDLLLASQVSQMLQLGINRVYAQAHTGLLPSIRIGKSIRFPREALMTWIKEAQK